MLIYRALEPVPTKRISLANGKLEVLGSGAQFVAFGIHPDTGRAYVWINDADPFDTAVESLPEVTPLQLENLCQQALRIFPQDASCVTPLLPLPPAVTAPPEPRHAHGRVVDGRDQYLTECVMRQFRRLGLGTSEQELARAAWREFASTADLTRPKRDGRQSWCFQDALEKARYTLRRAEKGILGGVTRARCKPVRGLAATLPPDIVDGLLAHTDMLFRNQRIDETALRVNNYMLRRLDEGQFVDSVSYIMQALAISESTVQRARRQLIAVGVWRAGRQLGRRHTAPYFLCPKLVQKIRSQMPEQIVLSDAGLSRLTPNTSRCGVLEGAMIDVEGPESQSDGTGADVIECDAPDSQTASSSPSNEREISGDRMPDHDAAMIPDAAVQESRRRVRPHLITNGAPRATPTHLVRTNIKKLIQWHVDRLDSIEFSPLLYPRESAPR